MAVREITKERVDLRIKRFKLKYPKLWLARFHHLNVHNKPMRFGDKYRFLIPLYKLEERNICVEKSVQCGASELMIVTALHEASVGLRILYVMPNIDLRGKFVKDRLDRLLKAVPYYAQLIRESYGDSTSIGLKHFGKGLLNFVGSNSPAEFVSYPADSLYIDEVDKCDQSNLDVAPDRLDASEYKNERRIGNPSVQNWGIDSHFMESTQTLWYIKCESCNEWQTLNFFENVIEKTGELVYRVIDKDEINQEVYAVCKKCGKRIDRMKKGEWVETYKGREKKGFRISQLFSANVTLFDLVNQYNRSLGNAKKFQIFYNSKLGLPFSSSENKITLSLLQKASEGTGYTLKDIYPYTQKRVYIGIDVGIYYHIIVREMLADGRKKLIAVRKIENTNHLINFLKKMRGIKYIIIDELPEIREVEKIKKAVMKIYSCTYRNGRTIFDVRRSRAEWKKERRVSIDRTFILDEVKADFVKQLMINPVNAFDIYNEEMNDYGEYYEQLLSSTRVFVETSGQARGRFEWRESAPDHFFHAEAYCKLAELLDPNVVQYYIEKVSKYEGMTKAEVEAKEKKAKPLIPQVTIEEMEAIKEGKMKVEDSSAIQEMSVTSAESFLRNLFYHTEEFLGQRNKK